MRIPLSFWTIVTVLILPASVPAQVQLTSYPGYESKIMSLKIEGLYSPALYFRSTTEGKRPLAIFLHGAGGGRGGKIVNSRSEVAQQLSEQNLVCDVIHPLSPGRWSPKALEQLAKKLHKWREEADTQMLMLNPNYDPRANLWTGH